MMYTHHIPGRLRVRTAAVKHNPARAADFRAWLESIPGVRGVEVNALTGSALVQYDAEIADGTGLLMLMQDEGWLTKSEARPPVRRKRQLLPPKTVQRMLAKAILRSLAEAAIERSVMALAAAIL